MRIRPGIAIDLGTVNTLVHVAGRGLAVEEPSVIAFERGTKRVAGVGVAAAALSGREPEGIDVIWPLRDGVIADIEAATLMLDAFLGRARVRRGVMRALALICVPRSATSVERQAVEVSVEHRHPHCSARLLEEPLAASVGAGVPPWSNDGTLVVDVGGGTTDIAVVAGGGVVRGCSLRVGGNAMDEAIAHAVQGEFGLSLGHHTAEQLKFTLGLTGGDEGWAEAVGVDVAREALREVRVPAALVSGALERSVAAIVAALHGVLCEIPPDLADDIKHGTIHLAGGGALLLGLADRIEASTGLKAAVVEDPLRCVVRGAAWILEHGSGIGGATAA